MVLHFEYPATGQEFHARPNQEAAEEYREVFLSHSKLYVVADKYGIDLLAKQVVRNLSMTLKSFTLHQNRVQDILSLVEHVFGNTRSNSDLRSMLVHYCACTIEDMSMNASFQDFLEDFPEFSAALVAKMIERLD